MDYKKMRTYHITYYNDNDLITIGENYKTENVFEALKDFEIAHPKAVFVAMHDVAALSWVDINRGEFQKRADEDDYNKTYP